MAENIVLLLERFEKMSRPGSRIVISQPSDEEAESMKENKMIKTQEAIP